MPVIEDQDLPPGLADSYLKIFGNLDFRGVSAMRKSNISVPRSRRQRLLDQSLPLEFSKLYNPLEDPVRAGWTDYWNTLPNSPHTGANGWPGTGFSAFLLVNAPANSGRVFPIYYAPSSLELQDGFFCNQEDNGKILLELDYLLLQDANPIDCENADRLTL